MLSIKYMKSVIIKVMAEKQMRELNALPDDKITELYEKLVRKV